MKRIVIIGGVAGGMSAATRMRRLDASAEVIVLEKSGHVSYANCGLPYFVGGIIENEQDLLLQTPESLHARFRLDVRVYSEALGIDPIRKIVFVKDLNNSVEYELSYDKLVLSPGASPVVPPIPGVDRAFTLRTVEDVELIVGAVAAQPRSAVVIGGGFIGVEIAENLAHRGIKTSLIEATHQVLAPLDPEMANFVHAEIIENQVDLFLGISVASVTDQEVILSDGTAIPAQLVVLAIGVKPDTKLAKAARLEVGTRGGITVSNFHQTSNQDIYAIGDAAEKTDALDGSSMLVPLANLANRHGRVVADHIAGIRTRDVSTFGTAIVKVFGLTIATTGWNEKRLTASGRKFLAIHSHPNSHAGYYPGAKQMSIKMLVDSTSQEILGAQAVGTEGVDKRIDVIATAMRGGLLAPELADIELAYAPPFGSAKDPVNMLGYISDNLLSGLVKSVQWSEVEQEVNAGSVLVDVRSASEFANGSIPSAINISIDELRERRSEIPAGELIVLCQVGQRGHSATLLLNEMGYSARNLDGGYRTWRNSPAGQTQLLVR